jgi:nicotinamidase-related amidase
MILSYRDEERRVFMKSALVLIDIQKDYFARGKNELFMPNTAAEKARMLLDYFRQKNLDVFHVQHISTSENAGFFRPNTEGAEIHPLVFPTPNEPVIVKHYPDSFLETRLEQELRSRQIDLLVICGMMSHMCIDTTVRSAKRLNFTVLLAEDACTTRDLTWDGTLIPANTVHQTMMAALNGMFAQVEKTKTILNILLGK